ncbi:hypothetical protein GA0115254_101310 [Streptomyces sp. Ncost-T10-10d]|nr:hypothetical protein GA0115254_101310 [Streptomyces sp. Ncost-T10-10d]
MRPVQAELLAERTEHRDHARQVVRNTVGQRRGGTETGKIHGYHIPFHGQDGQHRIPGLTVVADAVKQEQRLPGTGPFIRHGHGPRPLR